MSTPLTRTAAVTRAALTTAMLTLTAAISVGAGWLSFLAIRDLATLVGWPANTAWVVQRIVELFLVVGSLEIVCRAWEGRTDLAYPKTLIAAALTVVLLANVSDHVLRAAQAGHPGSLLVLVGALAALVPAAQLGSLHLMSGRLDPIRSLASSSRIWPSSAAPAWRESACTSTLRHYLKPVEYGTPRLPCRRGHFEWPRGPTSGPCV